MKHLVNMGLLWTVVCGLLPACPTYAQCTLACNDQVQVSIPDEGFAIVIPDMVLEGDSSLCPGPKSVGIVLPNGQEIGDTVTCGFTGELLTVRVFDTGSGNFCWGSILVGDKLPPIITCPDVSVGCTADLHPDSIGLVTITDNCDEPIVNFLEQYAPQECTTSLTQTLTRTWYAADSSGNVSQPCTQQISIVRPALSEVVFPPHFDNTDTTALRCGNADTSVAVTGMPMVDGRPVGELCKINVFYEDQIIEGCTAEYTVLRHWQILDCCSGDILEHTQNIKIEDAEGPLLDCAASLTVSANGSNCDGFFLLPPVPATDNCSADIEFRTVVSGQADIEGNGGMVLGLPLGTYVLTYEATDGCGNQSTCDVALTVADDVPPVAVCDEITTVSLSSSGFANVAAEVFNDGSYDPCCEVGISAKRMDETNAPFAPSVLFDCGDIGDTVMVIVQVTDCEGNANTCMVEALPDDKLAPSITCPADVTMACTEWVAFPSAAASLAVTGEPTVQENCALDTLFFSDNENLNPCLVGNIVRTFTVVDAQGYTDNCTQTITTIDTTAVQYFFPQDTTVDCSQPLDSISAGEVFSIADCELIGLNVDDDIFPQPCGLKIFRTYTFLDWCSGFDTSYTQTIIVIDTNPPFWNEPFGSLDTAFVCAGDLVKPDPPTADDYCTPATVTLDFDTTVFMGCTNRYIRTLVYNAIDTCGNMAEPFVITLMVNDTVPPLDSLPDIGPFVCKEDIPPFVENEAPGAMDNCINSLDTVILLSETFDTTVCGGDIFRTYLLRDLCGLESIATQRYFYQDTIAPEPFDTILGPLACFSDIPNPDLSDFVGVDNCGGPVTSEFISDVLVDSTGCGGRVDRKWKLSDACGNFSVATQTILISDTIPPIIDCPVDVNLTILQDSLCEQVVIISVSAVDGCGGPVTISNSFTGTVGGTLNAAFPVGTTEVTFYAEDQCGNIDSCSMLINICEIRPPNNFCTQFDWFLPATGSTQLKAETLVEEGLMGGEDFCTDVTFELNPAMLDCSVLTTVPTPIQYTLTVTDECGNSSFCSNTLFLYDPTDTCDDDPLISPVVAGRVNWHAGGAMEGIEMQLSDDNGMNLTQTGEYGIFIFENMSPGASCSLHPYKDDDLLNGVTTFDLLLITKHILGTQPITSPYSLIAADVNASGAVTTMDIVQLRKAVLQVSDAFPNNTSWRFVEAGYEFPDPANPFLEDFPESTWLPNMTENQVAKNFVCLKVGDVNGSAVDNLTGGGVDDRFAGSLRLSVNEAMWQAGASVQVPIFAASPFGGGEIKMNDKILAALQGTIEYDAAKMTFRGIGSAAMKVADHDFAEAEKGFVTFSWFDVDGLPVTDGDELFYLQFDILENTKLSESIRINSMKTPAIAFENGGIPLNTSWHIHAAPNAPVDDASIFELAQNRPNPFRETTTVRFRLGEAMPVRLEVVDLTGRSFLVKNEKMSAGWQEVELGGEHFGSPGIYICRLVTPHGTAQRRMLFTGGK